MMSLYPGYIRRPHYYETDQMAIIHHANYIRWFEEARVDMLAFLQLPYHKIEEAGLIVPVLEVNEIYQTANNRLVTTGSSKHCFLSKETNRLVHLKRSFPEIHQVFSDYATLSADTKK